MRAIGALFGVSVAFCVAACHDTGVGAGHAASVSIDTIPSPSIVAGDSLRDSSGVVRPIKGTAYDNDGNPIPGFVVKYRALDSGIVLDSLTGYVVGDTARATPIRFLVDAGGLQTTPAQLFIVPQPDTFFTTDSVDTLRYSLTDVSSGLSLTLGHRTPITTTNTTGFIPVQAYLVSYQFENITDTAFVHIIDGTSHDVLLDTTATDGTVHPSLRVRPLKLPGGSATVALLATAKYRGVPVAGSPIRLVVRIQYQ